MGGSFKLNLAPRQYFDENPFRSERALPPAKKSEDKKWDVKPFKPSSPAKQVLNVTLMRMHWMSDMMAHVT